MLDLEIYRRKLNKECNGKTFTDEELKKIRAGLVHITEQVLDYEIEKRTNKK